MNDRAEFVYNFMQANSRPVQLAAERWAEQLRHWRALPRALSPTNRHLHPYLDDPGSVLMRVMVKDPEGFQETATLASAYYAKIYMDDEMVAVVGRGESIAAKQRYLRWLTSQKWFSPTMWKTAVSMTIFGIGWLDDSLWYESGMRFGSEDGLTVASTSFSRWMPRIRPISVFRIIPPWDQPWGQEMRGAVTIRPTTATDLVLRAENDSSYDMDALLEAIGRTEKGSPYMSEREGGFESWRALLIDGLSPGDFDLPIEFRPCEVLEYRGENPFWAEGDPPEDRYGVIGILNGKLIREGNHPYYPHPFHALTVNQFNERAWGMGHIEAVQYELDRLDAGQTLELEAQTKVTRQPILVGQDGRAVKYHDKLEEAPTGSVVEVSTLSEVGTLKFDLAGMFALSSHRVMQKQMLRQGSGALDNIAGMSPPGEQTATESASLDSYANSRLDSQVDVLENSALVGLAEAAFQRAAAAFDSDEELQRFVEGATRAQLVAEEGRVMFKGSRRARAAQSVTRAAQTIAQLVSAFPPLQYKLDIEGLFTKLIKLVDADLAEELILTPEKQFQEILKQTVIQQLQAGASPQARKGTPSPPKAPAQAGAAIPPRT